MPLFNILNQATDPPVKSQTATVDYDNLAPLLTDSEWVSAKAALRNSDLYAIINQLSNDLAAVKFTPKIKKYQGILDKPTSETNSHSFWQSVFAQLLLGGEAFIYRWRNENGVDVRWEFIRPSNINFNHNEYKDGLYYNVTFEDPREGSIMRAPQNDVLHFRLLSVDGGRTGESPLLSLTREMDIQKQSDRLTLDSLKNALNANGVLKIKGGGLLSAKQKRSRSRQAVKEMQGGPLVLDDLEDFTPLEIKSNVADLLEQTDWTSRQFAKVYGISDSYVGGQGDQQSSLDMISGAYANAVSRYLRPVISELSSKLFTDIDTDVFKAVDPLGATYINRIKALADSDIISSEQGLFMLQQAEVIPQKLPERSQDKEVIKEDD